MAKMIPKFGAAPTDSQSEPLIYDLLNDGLSDDFTVIHSLPWLCAAVKEIDGVFPVPTGEIDFLILHPELGILAIEVKGGRYKIEGAAFVLLRSGARIDALRQTRRNTHGLARWLAGRSHIFCRIGYALCFPDSNFEPTQLPPGLVDPTGATLQSIVLTLGNMPRLAERIIEVMCYWRAALRTPSLGKERVREISDLLCPNFNESSEWGQQVLFDNHFWLRLTDEQAFVVNKVLVSQRSIITGWPGTGKTLIGIEVARRLKKSGARIAVVTFNALLRNYLAEQLSDKNCDVFTWHKLCSQARTRLTRPPIGKDVDWFEKKCFLDLKDAIDADVLEQYDVLILDEAQALRPEWCSLLISWFAEKNIVALCDETQVFSFERDRTTLAALSDIVGVKPFYLTVIMRMPKAVTDRLVEVLPSPVQLTSPRKFDAATIREMVVDDIELCLDVITDDLFCKGIREEEIVLLTKYAEVSPEIERFCSGHPAVRKCSIARFRGMEAPVIVVLKADELSDQELFCAYSRATTLCFVIFSAHGLLRYKEGAFLPGVVDRFDNKEVIEALRHRSYTGTLLALHLKKPVREIESVSISWSDQWLCWLVRCSRSGAMSLWVDFLVMSYPWPVLFWYEDSHNSAFLAKRAAYENGVSTKRVSIASCKECGETSPFIGSPKACSVCAGELGESEASLKVRQVKELVKYDQLVKSLIAAPIDKVVCESHQLPFILRIAALGERALVLHPYEEIVSGGAEDSSRGFYRWACVLVKALILLLPKGSQMSVAEIAAATYHQDLSDCGIDQKMWYEKIALALNLHRHHDYLVRVGKGRYLTVVD